MNSNVQRRPAATAVALSVLLLAPFVRAAETSSETSPQTQATTQAGAATDDVIQAVWKAQEISFHYQGFTTAYSCDALEDKVEKILRKLGAHESTTVRAQGCDGLRPTRFLTLKITAISPIAATPENLQKLAHDRNIQKLAQRFGGKRGVDTDEFPAQWRTVSLSRERSLNLEPGDCELMDRLKEQVFPKLEIKVVEDEVECTPNQLTLNTPVLVVSALTKAPSADEKKP